MTADQSQFGGQPSEARAFEESIRQLFQSRWGVTLSAQKVPLAPRLHKSFDLVSSDLTFIGDAKYYKNLKVPAGKWSTVAEYVWLLEKTSASFKFLVFGRDREVPERWLARFGPLVQDVGIFFYAEPQLEPLNDRAKDLLALWDRGS